ncbi:N-acetylglucosamine/diacetylchitobiose ABC transporter substrate-binding protein [Kribbella deserti]|uniref:N-acetylglucosamine/diacetylchitobiose ABC transporter substrate-binding protein n=1 Tax=Kribbella deserti TaxID=1926257 RepID=A0ABV6QRP5_9ACTN
MNPDHRPTRRAVLRQALASAAVLTLAGCSEDKPAPSAPDPNNPFGVGADSVLDVAVADGRSGDTKVPLELYKQKFPQATATVVALPQLATALQPRFDAGNPPDVVHNSGPDQLALSNLVAGNGLSDLAPLLKAPSWDRPQRTVGDSLVPGTLESGSYDGTARAIPYVATVHAIWYSAPLFERRGWEVPRSWTELIRTAITLKAKGLAPFTFAGAHPYYILEPILTQAAKSGGHEVMVALDNLEDGAWHHPGLQSALKAFGELSSRGLVLKGSHDLDHTASQTRFLTGKAAFLPCGNWLENEMAKVLPKGFGLTALAIPPLDDAKLPNGVHVAFEQPVVLAEKAPNPAGGAEFIRAMLSAPAASAYAATTNTLTVVRGAYDSEQASTAVRSAGKLLDLAGDQVIRWYFDRWYPTLAQTAADATGAFMAGALTSAEWSNRLQKAADTLKQDKSVPKYRRD